MELERLRQMEGLESQTGAITDNLQPVNIDELLQYEDVVSRGGMVWLPLSQTHKKEEYERYHQNLRSLIQKQRMSEKYFDIENYPIYDIRVYVLSRLLKINRDFVSNFEDSEMEPRRRKYPTDTEILAHLFFKYLAESENLDGGDKLFRHLVFSKNIQPINSFKSDYAYFQKTIGEGNEIHYDIYNGSEFWPVLPGRDNLFNAIVLFIYHIKKNKAGLFGSDQSSEIRNLINEVVPTF